MPSVNGPLRVNRRRTLEWQPITTAPYDAELGLAVIDAKGTHALVFPCRRIPAGWLKCGTDEWVEVYPTHWREWRPVGPNGIILL